MRARTFIPILAAMALAVTVPHTAAAQDHDSDPGQSIQVHGHWIIEVYDGEELVERREFDNALAPDGGALLSHILAGEDHIHPSYPSLVLSTADDPTAACLHQGDPPYGCISGLTVTTPTTGENAGALVLDYSGEPTSISSFQDSIMSVTAVKTNYLLQDSTGANTRNGPLTEKALDPPVDIRQDQTANITVIISFTSG